MSVKMYCQRPTFLKKIVKRDGEFSGFDNELVRGCDAAGISGMLPDSPLRDSPPICSDDQYGGKFRCGHSCPKGQAPHTLRHGVEKEWTDWCRMKVEDGLGGKLCLFLNAEVIGWGYAARCKRKLEDRRVRLERYESL
ncbi:hypothetical protein V8E54_005306 [Elaphomyces granulatus]